MSSKVTTPAAPERRTTLMLDIDGLAELQATALAKSVSLARLVRGAVGNYLSDPSGMLRGTSGVLRGRQVREQKGSKG